MSSLQHWSKWVDIPSDFMISYCTTHPLHIFHVIFQACSQTSQIRGVSVDVLSLILCSDRNLI